MASRVAFLLLAFAVPVSGQDLQLPFDGRWFVMQGGDTPNVNHHVTIAAQAFGIDFVRVGGVGGRQLSDGTPASVEDFYSWGQPVLSPAGGTVVGVVNDQPDNVLGKKDTARPAGNHVVIDLGNGRYAFLAHMQRGSVPVKAGDTIRPGQRLGLCGNSGNSDYPHIHLHVQNTPELNRGQD
ncbi:MAG: M23 family metallopeptidase [Acidobacteria bacterium]|nr:M23 family metallopeptidase [Acidobacteriota bacterium]